MTCIELLKVEHPEKVGSQYSGGALGCPYDYDYLTAPEWCGDHVGCCTKCWGRKVPENVLREHKANFWETVAPPPKLPQIQDTGDRTQFDTGAVRDMHKGKGRCDLMPLAIVADMLKDENVRNLWRFQRTGNSIYLRDVLRSVAQPMFLSMESMILETAIHFEQGAEKYGENNWQKGIPVWCYIDSAVRHYLKFLRGDTDERHDRAFVWNILCCIWTVENEGRKQVSE